MTDHKIIVCGWCHQTWGDGNKHEECWKPKTMTGTKTESTIQKLAAEIGALTAEKNQAYGNSFAESAKFLAIIYPDGIKPEQYKDVLLLVRMFDKMMRIANKKDAFGESPYRDIAGYGLLGVWEEAQQSK